MFDDFRRRVVPFALLAALYGPTTSGVSAQSVMVDQGVFSISIEGRLVGTEDFSIRRAGFGNDAVFIASGAITTTDTDPAEEVRTLLRATAPDGAADGYEIKVSGPAEATISLNSIGPRFVSRFESDEGQEEREFRARPGTRIVERHVAHHFYFLRDVPEGGGAHVIEPRSRTDDQLVAGPWLEEEIRIGRNRIEARRVVVGGAAGERTVWFDRQGRVLRVEVPAADYVAVREDLVG